MIETARRSYAPVTAIQLSVIVLASSLIAGAVSWASIVASRGHASRLLSAAMVSLLALSLCLSIPQVLRVLRELQWWHSLWLLTFLSALVFRVRDADEIRTSPVDFWALYRISLMIIVGTALVAYVAARRMPVRAFRSGAILPLTVFGLIGIASTLWSVFPAWTLYKSIEFFVDIVLVAASVYAARTIRDISNLSNLTLGMFTASIGSLWLGALILPELGFRQGIGLLGLQLEGFLPAISANYAGEMAAIVGVILITRLLSNRQWQAPLLLCLTVSFITLVFAQTRAAIGGFAIATALVLFLLNRARYFVLLGVACVGLALFSNLDQLLLDFLTRGQHPAVLRSLTGRTFWWSFGWDVYIANPVLGLGAYAGGRFAVLAAFGATQTSHIHNAWLEALFGTGLIGIPFLLAAFVIAGHRLFQAAWKIRTTGNSSTTPIEALGVLAALSVTSLFSSNLIWHPATPFLMVVACSAYFTRAVPSDTRLSPPASQSADILDGSVNPKGYAEDPCE